MLNAVKRGVRQFPALDRQLVRVRDRAHYTILRLTEKAISRTRNYEILVVFGMRRSGNHLAINWILEQIEGSAVFYNNINPELSPYSAQMTEFRLRPGRPGRRIVLSYEDVTPHQMLAGPLTAYLADRVARHGAKVRFALILRDPYNMFASRLQKWPERFTTEDQIQDQISLYKELFVLAASPQPIWNQPPLVPVLYNDLVSDPVARDRVADALGIRRGARGMDQVPVYGHGSSFDGQELSGQDLREQVLNRWHRLGDNPAFHSIVADPEIRAAGQTLFGMNPPDQR